MAKTSILDRFLGAPPEIDWDKLNKNLADARAQLDLANDERQQLALVAVMKFSLDHNRVQPKRETDRPLNRS